MNHGEALAAAQAANPDFAAMNAAQRIAAVKAVHAAPKVGDLVTLPVAWNTNGVKRSAVTGRVVGFRALLIVLDTTEGPFCGEGVWGFTEDARKVAYVVRLTRRDLTDGEITDSTFLVKASFDSRHEANLYALAASRYPHIVAVSVTTQEA